MYSGSQAPGQQPDSLWQEFWTSDECGCGWLMYCTKLMCAKLMWGDRNLRQGKKAGRTGEITSFLTDMHNLTDNILAATKLYNCGDYFRAELICPQILDGQPDNSDALCLLGRIKYHLSKNQFASTTDVGNCWFFDSALNISNCTASQSSPWNFHCTNQP